MKSSTRLGSNCVPAQRRSSASASLRAHRLAGRARVAVIASKASQTAMMRAPSGISSPREAVGVAAAVPALVARADEPGDAARSAGAAREDALADQRVLAHQLPLRVVERPGLVEDLVGDRDLADVVQLGGAREHVELLGVEAEPPRRRAAASAATPSRWSLELRLALAQEPQQHVARLAARPSRRAGSSARTCAGRRAAARRSASRASSGSTTAPQEARDREARRRCSESARRGRRRSAARRRPPASATSTQNSSPPSR